VHSFRNICPIVGPTPRYRGTQSGYSQSCIYIHGRSIILPTCYCKELNLQYDVDLSSASLHQRHLHLIKAKCQLCFTRMPPPFLSPYYQILNATKISVRIHIFRQTWSSCHILDRLMAAGDFLHHHQTCLVSLFSGALGMSNPLSCLELSTNLIPLLVVRYTPSVSCAMRPF
jgi:hypothetical protein